MHKLISSTQNPFIKALKSLQEKSRVRRKTKAFVIEGLREINLAIQAGYEISQLLFCPSILPKPQLNQLLNNLTPPPEVIELTEEVYKKIAYRSRTEGLLAKAQSKNHDLASLVLPENPLILVAEAPEKPGNIGALLRTADAAGVDAFILANPRTDLYNPNIIRSSVGGVFTLPIATGSTREVIEFLTLKNIGVYAAILQQALSYVTQDYKGATALVVGTEAEGLSPAWLERSHQNIRIPMQGSLDSMNVSVAAAILIFEARRQRGFKTP